MVCSTIECIDSELFRFDLGMRFSLADAGDSIEDGNFEVEIAEAHLLRLYTFLDWVKEVLHISSADVETVAPTSDTTTTSSSGDGLVSSLVNWVKEKLHLSSSFDHPDEVFTEEQKKHYRTDTNFNYYDRMFESAINRSIQLAEENYEKMLYKDVLKYGFFELQLARDNYRELCSDSEQMNLRLIKRFIEVQILLLAPICPHICEYIYQYLHPSRTIMNARWPTIGNFFHLLLFLSFNLFSLS